MSDHKKLQCPQQAKAHNKSRPMLAHRAAFYIVNLLLGVPRMIEYLRAIELYHSWYAFARGVFFIPIFQKFRPSCDQFVTVKFFRLCSFDRVCGVVCQSLLPPTSVCRLRGVIGAKLAALVLPLFKKQAHIRVELRRALSIKGNRAPPLLAAGRVLHIDLENE